MGLYNLFCPIIPLSIYQELSWPTAISFPHIYLARVLGNRREKSLLSFFPGYMYLLDRYFTIWQYSRAGRINLTLTSGNLISIDPICQFVHPNRCIFPQDSSFCQQIIAGNPYGQTLGHYLHSCWPKLWKNPRTIGTRSCWHWQVFLASLTPKSTSLSNRKRVDLGYHIRVHMIWRNPTITQSLAIVVSSHRNWNVYLHKMKKFARFYSPISSFISFLWKYGYMLSYRSSNMIFLSCTEFLTQEIVGMTDRYLRIPPAHISIKKKKA